MTTPGPNGTTSDSLASPGGAPEDGRPSAPHRDSSVHAHHVPARFFTRARAFALAALVLLFLAATVTGRALSPALLGWRAGIELWIERSELAASFLGQLAVVAGALMAIQLLIATLVESDLSVSFRLSAAPITAGVVTLVMASATRGLPVLLSLALAGLTGVLALAASVPTVVRDHTRAAGLVLALGGLTALVQAASRLVSVWATHEVSASAFRLARGLATVSFLFDVLVLAAVTAWLAARRWKVAVGVTGAAVALSIGVSVLALRGSLSAAGWSVFASQALASLARNPWPLVPPVAYYSVQVALLLGAALTLTARRSQPFARAAIAFALLARPGTDIPVLGLALLLASLLGPLSAAREIPSAPEQVPGDRDRETDEREQQPRPPADPKGS